MPILLLRKWFSIKHRPLPKWVDDLFFYLAKIQLTFGTTILAVKKIVSLEEGKKHDALVLTKLTGSNRRNHQLIGVGKRIMQRIPVRSEVIGISKNQSQSGLISSGISKADLANHVKSSSCDFVVIIETNSLSSLRFIPDTLDHLIGGADLVVGSRCVYGAKVRCSLLKRILILFGNLFMRLRFGGAICDYGSGLMTVRKNIFLKLMTELNCASIVNHEYFVIPKLLIRAHRSGYRAKEIPLWWTDAKSCA